MVFTRALQFPVADRPGLNNGSGHPRAGHSNYVTWTFCTRRSTSRPLMRELNRSLFASRNCTAKITQLKRRRVRQRNKALQESVVSQTECSKRGRRSRRSAAPGAAATSPIPATNDATSMSTDQRSDTTDLVSSQTDATSNTIDPTTATTDNGAEQNTCNIPSASRYVLPRNHPQWSST